MLNGDTPFLDPSQDHIKIYKQILMYCKMRLAEPQKKLLKFPHSCDPETQDLINGLLNPRAALRYGCKSSGFQEIFDHPFFHKKKDFDWQALQQGRLKPPYSPIVVGDFDTSNFEDFADPQAEEKTCTIM